MTPQLLQLRVAFLSARRAGLRSVMAAGTTAMAIACSTAMLALNAGAGAELEASAASADRKLLTITAGLVRAPPGRGRGRFASPNLRLRDAADLSVDVPGVRTVVPMIESARPTKLGRTALTTSIRGVAPPYVRLRGFTLRRGRALDEHDAAARGRVALVGAFVARRLGGGSSIVGETLRIGGVPFEIVGELEPKGLSSDGSNEDNQVLIPFETAARRLFNVDYLSALLVEAANADRLPEMTDAARDLLRRNHKLDSNVEDDFEILTSIRGNALGGARDALLQRVARVVLVTTLLVAGVGVLIVTSMNVADRVPEIGLRLAIGARRKDIAALFLAEACCLSSVGGIVGVTAGLGGVAILAAFTGWAAAVDARAIAAPLAASVLIGIVFGTAPALRAARLAPTAALGAA